MFYLETLVANYTDIENKFWYECLKSIIYTLNIFFSVWKINQPLN